MVRMTGSILPDSLRSSYATQLGVALGLAVLVMVAFGVLISTQASATLEEDVRNDMTTLSESQAAQSGSPTRNAASGVRRTTRHWMDRTNSGPSSI